MSNKIENPTCAFCGLIEDECDTLLSTDFSEDNQTFICSDCIETCVEILVKDADTKENATIH